MKRKTLRELLQLMSIGLCTIIITLVGISFFSRLLTPKSAMEQYYDEPRNSLDALFIGSSHCGSSVSPIDIYNKTGVKSYNINTGFQPSWVTYYYMRDALTHQKPKVVFIEVFGAFYGKSYASIEQIDEVSSLTAQQIKPSLDLLLMNLAIRKAQLTILPWYDSFNIAKYHSRITDLKTGDFTAMLNDSYGEGKGFAPAMMRKDFSDYIAPITDRREPLYEKCDYYLRETVKYARKKGVEVVFFKAPFITSENDVATLNSLTDLSKELGVDFIDFCSNALIDIDYSSDFSDNGHVNYFGAKKISDYLADYMTAKLGDSLSTAPNELWNTAATGQLADFAKAKFKLCFKIDHIFRELPGSENVNVVFARQGQLTTADLQLIQSKNPQTPQSFLDAIAENDLVVLNGSRLIAGKPAYEYLAQNGITVKQENGISYINISGTEKNFSRERDGLNVAFYDKASNSIFHNYSMAREHNFDYFTS